MPRGATLTKDSGQKTRTDGAPETQACKPRPPVCGEPGGDDFIPDEFGRFELRGFAGEAEVRVHILVEGIEPGGLFPGYDCAAGAAALPFRIAKILKGPG